MSNGFVTMGKNLNDLSNRLSQMSTDGSIFSDSSGLLSGLTSKIEKEVSEMKENLFGGISPDELRTMSNGFITMGENLGKLSDGLTTIHEKSGMMIPYFPHNQKELDNILYDDGGKLREMFSDTIVDDNHMMLMIKLKGNLDDSTVESIYKDLTYAMDKENFATSFII